MEQEKTYRAAACKDTVLLAFFAVVLTLMVAYVAYEAVCAVPEYAVPVILAAIAAVGVLCSLLLQISRFLKKHAAMVYQNENHVPKDGEELTHA